MKADTLTTCDLCGQGNIYSRALGAHQRSKHCAEARAPKLSRSEPHKAAAKKDCAGPEPIRLRADGDAQVGAGTPLTQEGLAPASPTTNGGSNGEHAGACPSEIARFGGTLGAQAPEGALTIADNEDAVLGLQLEMQWDKAVGGQRDQIVFGAMMMKLKARCDSARGVAKLGNKDREGTGLKGWLKKHAPKVTEGTAYRLMEIAEGVQAICKLGKKVDLEELLGASVESLPEKLGKMREKIEQLIEGKSQRQLLLEFSEAKPKGGKRDKGEETPLTPEQQQEVFLAACREDFRAAFERLDTLNLNHHWKAPSIADAEVESAVAAAQQYIDEAQRWLKTPQKHRTRPTLPVEEEEETAAPEL